jgi:hypothetical protein
VARGSPSCHLPLPAGHHLQCSPALEPSKRASRSPTNPSPHCHMFLATTDPGHAHTCPTPYVLSYDNLLEVVHRLLFSGEITSSKEPLLAALHRAAEVCPATTQGVHKLRIRRVPAASACGLLGPTDSLPPSLLKHQGHPRLYPPLVPQPRCPHPPPCQTHCAHNAHICPSHIGCCRTIRLCSGCTVSGCPKVEHEFVRHPLGFFLAMNQARLQMNFWSHALPLCSQKNQHFEYNGSRLWFCSGLEEVTPRIMPKIYYN